MKTKTVTSDDDIPNIITNRAADEIIDSLHRVKIGLEALITDRDTSALATFALAGIAVELDATMHACERFRVRYRDGSGGPPDDDGDGDAKPEKKDRAVAPKCPSTGKRHKYGKLDGRCECGAFKRGSEPAAPNSGTENAP